MFSSSVAKVQQVQSETRRMPQLAMERVVPSTMTTYKSGETCWHECRDETSKVMWKEASESSNQEAGVIPASADVVV